MPSIMPSFPHSLETDRLRFERLHPDAFDPMELYEHVRVGAPAIEKITRYVTWSPYEEPGEAVEWVALCGERFDAGDLATYVVRPKDGAEAGELAGLTGLDPDRDRQIATFGTWFREPFWGRGYFGEQAARLLELAFDGLGLEVVAVTHAPGNDRSRRAIEKLIDRFDGHKAGYIRNDLVVDGEPRDSIRYSISLEEWKRNR